MQRGALIVGNPVARGVSGELLREVGRRASGSLDRVLLQRTTRPGEAVELVADAIRDIASTDLELTTVVAVGGDGTVREVAEGIARGLGRWPAGNGGAGDGRPVMIVVPAGSGNSAYGAIWGEHDWPDLLSSAGEEPPGRRLDLLRLVESDEATLLGVNAGLGGEVARQLQGVEDVDDAKRWEAIGRALADRRPFPARVVAGGETMYEGLVTQVTVGGVRRFMGGGFAFLPRSSLYDGLLDVCVITDVDDAAIGELAALMPPGRHLGHPNVVYAQARTMCLERLDGADLDAEHDGDPMTAGRTITVEVVAGAVSVAGG